MTLELKVFPAHTAQATNLPQSVLSLEIPTQPTIASVHFGSNTALKQAAMAWLDFPNTVKPSDAIVPSPFRIVLIWGQAGCGKTLLAQALVNESNESHESDASYLNRSSSVADFVAAHSAQAVVVDDIDTYNDTLATAAFDLFNHIRANPLKRWWATASVPPAQMLGLRADISSRMAWGLSLEILPLQDTDSVGVMQQQAARLGFDLGAESAQYLLLRLERNLSRLAAHLASLNHYALALKKPVTPYLVQQWYAQVYLAKTA